MSIGLRSSLFARRTVTTASGAHHRATSAFEQRPRSARTTFIAWTRDRAWKDPISSSGRGGSGGDPRSTRALWRVAMPYRRLPGDETTHVHTHPPTVGEPPPETLPKTSCAKTSCERSISLAAETKLWRSCAIMRELSGASGLGGTFGVRRGQGGPRRCDGSLHELRGRLLTLPANQVVDGHAKNGSDGSHRLHARVFANASLKVSDIAIGKTSQFREIARGDLAEFPGFLQPLRELGHVHTLVSIDTSVVKKESSETPTPPLDTIVAVSRAAKFPLPPPPPGTVWARIEEARESEGMTYGELSKESDRAIGHYRLIATRNGWTAHDDVTDSFVETLVKRGWSEVWLRSGFGRKRTDGKSVTDPARPSKQEIKDMRWRAMQELRDIDGYDIARAERLVHGAKMVPHRGMCWGDIYSLARKAGLAEDENSAAEKARQKTKKPTT